VNAYKVDSTLSCFEENGYSVTYANEPPAETDGYDLALFFAGTPEADESEGFDRDNIDLPENQNAAIIKLCEKIPTAVILYGSSAVAMPWAGRVNAILAANLPGEAGGAAVFDVLTGAVNPCGKLTETFPQKIEDNGAYLHFPGVNDTTFYGDGIFVGYRYYEKKKIAPLFPFGHGLSYTAFSYGGVSADKPEYNDDEPVTVTVDVTNTGAVKGKETVQIYMQPGKTARKLIRPVKELKAFQKIELAPGETNALTFTLGFRDFAWYDADAQSWRVEPGEYSILAAGSSADVRGEAVITVKSTRVEKTVVTRDTLMGVVWEIPQGRAFLEDILAKVHASGKTGDKEGDGEAYLKMVLAMPMKTLILIGIPAEVVDGTIATLNGGE
jgi:beta-glucosidase